MPYVLQRLVRLVVVLALVSLGVLLLVDLLPGDPAVAIGGENLTPEQTAAIRADLRLDDPLPVRWAAWVGGIAQGDFGRSVRDGQPVTEAILDRLPVTAEVAVLSLLVALLLSIPLACFAAYRRGGLVDRSASTASSVLLSSPSFLTAPLLLFLFAVTWPILPVLGWVPLTESVSGNLQHIILPVLALALPEVAILMRLLRADLVTTLQQDYILAARAKGAPASTIVRRHALRASSLTLVTLAGLNLGRLIGGTVIVEMLFVLPGLGQYAVQSIFAKDYVAVQGVVMFVAIAYVLINLLVELTYPWLDPRLRRVHR